MNITPPRLDHRHIAVRSLMSQYIRVASLLGALVLLGSAFGYFNVITTSNSLQSRAETTSRILGLTAEIRRYTSEAILAVQAFMLDPDQHMHQQRLQQAVDRSDAILQMISEEPIIQQFSLYQATQQLGFDFRRLRSLSEELFTVRTSANIQYPALAISSEVMHPIRNEIISILNLSILEYQEDPLLNTSSDDYQLLNETLLAWTTTLAEYRLYLTNRMGSFDPLRLLEHADSVNIHLQRVRSLSAEIQQLRQHDRLGFQGSELVSRLPSLIDRWQSAFEGVQEINRSGVWRQDINLLSNKLEPLYSAINLELNLIDEKVNQIYEETLNQQTSASSTQSGILSGIILLFLIYIIFSIKLLQRFIIKPIATIARALKDEAYQHGGFHSLQLTRTQETQDLIDAFSEMSQQVHKRQNELEHQAMHDSLTGLPNRLMLQQRLDYHLLIAAREKQQLIFMMLDLNRFKEINDTLGHHIGDSLLIKVGERISSRLRSVDTIARLGGDEFAVLLPNTNRQQAATAAENIHNGLEEMFIVHQYELQISSSIGIAEYPADGDNSHKLMQHADVAMYISKREKSRYHYYNATEDSHSVSHLSLSSDLKLAIEQNLLSLHYQPKYQLSNGKITGAEALLRWQHPQSGFITPEVIISLAEDMGMINELSRWVINSALSFCGTKKKQGHELSISINLSVQNLRDPELDHFIDGCIKDNQLDSSCISFEITESAMMTSPEKSIQALNRLHRLGVGLSVDDFGTGFSSLAYLKLLPVNELKIDKSFIMDMVQDETDRLIVRSTIELSHNLGLKVVAEGVETRHCWDMLYEMGCDTAQGYYMSKPLEELRFSQLLEHRPMIRAK